MNCSDTAGQDNAYPFVLVAGNNRMAYKASLAAETTLPSAKPGVTFVNGAPQPVQFVVDGLPVGQSPCVAPGASAAVDLPEGVRRVTPVVKASCAAATGTSFDAVNINVTRSGNVHLRFQYNIAKT
jgi:hypothetical protein